MKWLVNTSERRIENGEPVIIQGSHIIEADSAEQARCEYNYKKFPYEKIDSIYQQVEKKKKK